MRSKSLVEKNTSVLNSDVTNVTHRGQYAVTQQKPLAIVIDPRTFEEEISLEADASYKLKRG